MAAVFPRTPATVNPAGEGLTVPAVSLGSLGPRRSLGCGLRGGCTMCMLNSLCWPGAAQRSMDVREEAALHLCGVLGWRSPAAWVAMVGGGLEDHHVLHLLGTVENLYSSDSVKHF